RRARRHVDLAGRARRLDLVVAGALHARVPARGVLVGLLHRPQGDAGARRLVRDLTQQLADDGVAVGGDADALAVAHEVDDDPGGRPRLARAGGTLDRQVA